MRFDGKRVLITGAGAGIGRASAEAFAAGGAWVCATDANPATLVGFIAAGGTICGEVLDVTDAAAIAALAAAIGPVDILFNCAGIVASGTILETSRADWDRSFGINATAIFQVTQAFLPGMLAQQSGVIVNMASVVSSLKGFPNRCAYGASKAAVIGRTKSIAADYVTQGIRCNAICAGTVDTPSLRQRLQDTGDFDGAMRAFVARQPLGRLARADEIAELVLYLASDAATFITGQAVAIDGGISI
jgi:2-keto-3-deoxy-L-fuconate dehydrogenase